MNQCIDLAECIVRNGLYNYSYFCVLSILLPIGQRINRFLSFFTTFFYLSLCHFLNECCVFPYSTS